MPQQYLITAYDFTDAEALDRRLAARTAHLEGAKQLKADGKLILGGAMLSPEGKMIGSSLVMEFEREEEIQEWLDQEPYMLGKVWDKIDVKPFKVALL